MRLYEVSQDRTVDLDSVQVVTRMGDGICEILVAGSPFMVNVDYKNMVAMVKGGGANRPSKPFVEQLVEIQKQSLKGQTNLVP